MVLTVAALAYASVPIAIDAIRDDPDMSRKFRDMWEQAKANAGKAPTPTPVPPETEAMLDGALRTLHHERLHHFGELDARADGDEKAVSGDAMKSEDTAR